MAPHAKSKKDFGSKTAVDLATNGWGIDVD